MQALAAAGDRRPRDRPALRPRPWRSGGSASWPGSTRCGRSASTAPSRGCGSCTWPTARPASRPASSASPSSAWSAVTQGAVWIAGASSGIGAALAWELRRRGADVAISARRQERLESCPAGGCCRPARRHRPSAVIAAAHGCGNGSAARPRGDERRAVEPDGRGRLGRRGLRPAVDTNLRGLAHVIEAVAPDMRRARSGHDLRDRERRRLPRPARERGLRHDQGRRDQPARVAAHRSRAATASRSSPSARASWRPPDRRQHVPDAVHDPARRGRAADRRRASRRARPRSSSRGG